MSIRNTELELMDDPNVEVEMLREVFQDINRSNKMLGGNKITTNAVWELMKSDTKKSYTIYDLGCGDGMMLRELCVFLRKREIAFHAKGVELRDDVLQIAEESSKKFPEISYEKGNILDAKLYNNECDIVICSLTLHHFSNGQIPKILTGFSRMSRVGVVINDLQRSKISCVLFSIFRALFIKTQIARQDGMTSIKSGFRRKELLNFSKNIPNVIHDIRWKWAFRYVWIIRRPRLS